MYFGTNIILVTNNESIIGLLSAELIKLRNIDSILLRNYNEAIKSVEQDKPQAILINCQNMQEEPLCLNLIKKIREITNVPVILIVETYNPNFIKLANKFTINDIVPLQYCHSEILMRTIWSLQQKDLRRQHNKFKDLLIQLNAIDKKSGFYTSKYSSKVFQNEMDYITKTGIDGVFLAIEANKNAKLRPSKENLIGTIKNNVRLTDTVCDIKNQNLFYILLTNTNLEGALIVWNRINKYIGAENALCGCIYPIYNNKNQTYDSIEQILQYGIEQAETSPNFLYIDENSNKTSNENWLENDNLNINKVHKNFKLFKQIYNKKLENIIKPVTKDLTEEYVNVLSNTQTPIVETDNTYSIKFVNKRQESEFKITQEANYIIIDFIHSGFDSPENKRYKIGLVDVTAKEIHNYLENFIMEFKSCI